MPELELSRTWLANWLSLQMALTRDPDTRAYGLTQSQVADLVGLSRQHVHLILKHGLIPGPDTVKKLAAFFGENPLLIFLHAYLKEDEVQDYWEWHAKLGGA